MGGARHGPYKGCLPTKFKTGCNYAACAYEKNTQFPLEVIVHIAFSTETDRDR